MFFNSNTMPKYSEPLYRPPSEAHSLIFQITEGCSYNGCTFCGMYVTKKFKVKPVEAVKAEIDRIPEDVKLQVTKVFLADGDAVIYPIDGLLEILDHINANFPKLRRISAYAGPHAIMSKNKEEWRQIYERKLTLLYFGLESGNNKVLELMKKGMQAEVIEPHCIMLREIGFKLSVMVILGGGGKKYSKEHALDTAAWLTRVNPDYFSLLTLFIRRKKDYFDKIEAPTMGGLITEARLMVEHMNGRNMIFRSNHISNFVSLEGVLSKDKDKVLKTIDGAIDALKKKGGFDAVPDFYSEGMM